MGIQKKKHTSIKSSVTIISPLSTIETTKVYDTFWKFATLRQEVFFNKMENGTIPICVVGIRLIVVACGFALGATPSKNKTRLA